MRFVTYLLLAGTMLFSGYWALAAHLGTSQADAILDRAPSLSGQTGRVRGYPLEFETEIQAPRWQNAAENMRWQAETVTLTVPSLRPATATLRFPPRHQIDVAGQTHLLQTRDMTTRITAQTDLTLSAARLDLEEATLDPPLGIHMLGPVSAHLHHRTGRQYALQIDARDIVLSPETLALIDPAQTLSAAITTLRMTAELHFSAPFDLRGSVPALTDIALDALHVIWDDVEIGLEGQITRDAAGLLDGALRLSLSDWQVLHRLLTGSGLLSDDAAMMAGMLLASQAEPGSTAITLGLDLSASTLSLGPFALLQLPPL